MLRLLLLLLFLLSRIVGFRHVENVVYEAVVIELWLLIQSGAAVRHEYLVDDAKRQGLE